MLLIDKTVKAFVAQVASNDPAPGGGSVSSVVSSLGAALTSMVGELTVGRKHYEKLSDENKKKIDDNLAKVKGLIETLNVLVDEDTNAFTDYMVAMKLPKETDEDKKARSIAMEEALKTAMEVPLSIAKNSLEVLKLQKDFALHGNQNAITDAGVGALLACAGTEGAVFNVLINLGGISDKDYVAQIRKECEVLVKEAKEYKDETVAIVYKALQ